jgi:hypothetical protein
MVSHLAVGEHFPQSVFLRLWSVFVNRVSAAVPILPSSVLNLIPSFCALTSRLLNPVRRFHQFGFHLLSIAFVKNVSLTVFCCRQ